MFSRFFIDRPIFAAVLSLVITLAGGVAIFSLPIAQYPQITPPSIIVSCNYPGASAEVLAQTIAAPIEQQVNGVENSLYMSSQSTNDGSYSLTVTFEPGVNLNFAQVLVQNRVNLALPNLPPVVKQTGVVTRKRSPDILLIVSLISPRGRYDQLYLSNYALLRIRDELARIEGVGDVIMFGSQDYSMRIWVDPERLASYGLSAIDVVNALREQNAQVAAGQLGQQPAASGQEFQLPLTTLGRLESPEQFNEVVLKTTRDGRIVRIRDIGHAKLAAKSEDVTSKLDGHPCANIAIFQLPDANALATAERLRAKMEDLRQSFPDDVAYDIAYDTTPFVRESILEVFRTLLVAIILVAVVVVVFLQNWRSSVIPLVAVPVAIVGTFAAMAAFGFSLNNLTLFGLVLAIGIVVDDAIVVVEAVEHHIEEGLRPRAATIKAMSEVSGPVIAVALVLSAVFVPCAFISGITGQFFRQFALTIAVSTLISAINSLTLSPALAAILLQPRGARKDWFGRLLDLSMGWFFRLFDRSFRRTTDVYTRLVRLALRGSALVLIVYGGLLALTYWGFQRLPAGYIPNQDKGYLMASVQLPDAQSVEITRKAVDRIDRIAHEIKGVGHTIAIAGQSFVLGAYGSNFGQLFIPLQDFSQRRDPSLSGDAIAGRLRRRLAAEVPEAQVLVFGPPPVSGLGTAGGFKFLVEDPANKLTPKQLQAETDKLIKAARSQPALAGLFSIFRANTPQLYVDINKDEVAKMGLRYQDVTGTLQTYLGSLYVNDFNRFGRTWQVVVQAEGRFRNRVEDVKRLRVGNNRGRMVPIGAVASVRQVLGPLLLTRYNQYPAAAIQGNTAPGVSSGQAIGIMQTLARQELPIGMAYEWTEITYLQIQAGNTAMRIFALSVLAVFLVLAAQYESWSLPLAVILVVPLCLLGSITGVALVHGDINIFTQIGFVVLVGLASKNAILIVEFAKLKHQTGMAPAEATLQAVRLRLRPILMTSFAFILGVVPLLVARGAGAEMRRVLGNAVFSGMVGVTLFGIFLTPVFFYVIERLGVAGLADREPTTPLEEVLHLGCAFAGFGMAGLLILWVGGVARWWILALGFVGFGLAGPLLMVAGRALRTRRRNALLPPDRDGHAELPRPLAELRPHEPPHVGFRDPVRKP